MNTLRVVVSFALILCVGVALVASQGAQTNRQAPYHDHPSVEPLPATLDPTEFQENREAFVAYTLAARVRGLLYQIPCFCGCDRTQGHGSLLDCFVGRHGANCHLCQKEVLFCLHKTKRERPRSGFAMRLAPISFRNSPSNNTSTASTKR